MMLADPTSLYPQQPLDATAAAPVPGQQAATGPAYLKPQDLANQQALAKMLRGDQAWQPPATGMSTPLGGAFGGIADALSGQKHQREQQQLAALLGGGTGGGGA